MVAEKERRASIEESKAMSQATIKSSTSKPLIVNPDREARGSLNEANHFVIRVDLESNFDVKDVFVILSANTFSQHAEVLEKVVQRINKLRVFFVKLDGPKSETDNRINALLDKLSESPWYKLQPKLFVFQRWEEVNRILNAWCDGAQEESSAAAWVDGEMLLVKSCSLKKYAIKFSELKQLSQIAPENRSKFNISEPGDHLHWKKYDLHIDIIDAIRYAKEPEYRKQRDVADIGRNKGYGEAIADFRQGKGLTQRDICDITGLTERQLRRIEREGYPLSLYAAEKLAQAHKMPLNEYLNAIAKTLQSK